MIAGKNTRRARYERYIKHTCPTADVTREDWLEFMREMELAVPVDEPHASIPWSPKMVDDPPRWTKLEFIKELNLKKRKQVARWAIPRELWGVVLAATASLPKVEGAVPLGDAIMARINRYYHWRWLPWQLVVGDLAALPKNNGKTGVKSLRTLYMLDPVGLTMGALVKTAVPQGQPGEMYHAAQSGFTPLRRREEAQLAPNTIRTRAAAAGLSSACCFED
ncbi:MAG: hypothetical protein VX554_03375, partial [Candidatus Thermoplasmatota archaeon]|nr:hypothetical protein [Candidatus Thermoplasmatota archaeon]